MDFNYAHRDTSKGERSTPTAQFNRAALTAELEEIRLNAGRREIPVSDSETLCFLTTLLAAIKPASILEVGTAVGLSAAAMANACPNARITTIEKDKNFFEESAQNFKKLNIYPRITQILGDAAEVLPTLSGPFDFIFLDSAKVQYVKYVSHLKRLLSLGGTLLADDVLLFGYVSGEEQVPPKRKMIVEHLKEYITAVTVDPDLSTTVINLGNGLAMSVKIN